ncbi:MAG: T9SS type A sorting domain-containing protein [Flavobacteriales bacterium]
MLRIFFILFLFSTPIIAQDLYWPENEIEINTDQNATYFFQVSTVSIDQVISDYSLRIGAFYIDDNNLLKCGGISNLNGNSPFSISLFGDDSSTPEKDGFSSGEAIHWIALDMQANIVMNGIIALTTGFNLWSANTINVVSNLDFTSPIYGCTDQEACNYNPEAEIDNDQIPCEYASLGYDCFSNCIDLDQDGICDIDETEGCTDELACNFLIGATEEDNSCVYAEINFDCDGNCIDIDEDYVCDFEEVFGCTDSTFIEFNPLATENDNSCQNILVLGCSSIDAFNYNSNVNLNDSSCLYSFNLLFESNLSSEQSVYNFQINSLTFPFLTNGLDIGDIVGGFYYSEGSIFCAGYSIYTGNDDLAITLSGDDESTEFIDGFEDGQEIFWVIQDESTMLSYQIVLDYSSGANQFTANSINFVSAIYNSENQIGCTDESAFNFNPNAVINTNYCQDFIYGCTDENACNYNETANTDDESCYSFDVLLSFDINTQSFNVFTNATNPQYTWQVEDFILPSTLNSYIPVINGNFTVSVSDENGCVYSDEYLLEDLSINEVVDIVKIFPNPVRNNKVTISSIQLISQFDLYNSVGQYILGRNEINMGKTTFETNTLNKGIYYLKVILEEQTVRLKLIVD